MAFALISRYYGFSIDEIGGMSIYQFQSYLNNIPEIEKMFSGSESTKSVSTNTEDLIRMAEKKGIKIPKKY